MLPKKEIIRKEKEIKKIFKEKEKKYESPLLQLILKKNNLNNCRFLVITKKTIGNAFERNRTKRILKQKYSNIRHNIEKNYDIIVIPKQKILKIADLGEEIEKAINNG